ncbi:MAG: malto-oligosyltrehalose synthase [Gemmatimonadota bacterium]|nr:malto-oligosyltrehalose synthase [Gemmatimonadota bacterium]
MTLPAPHRTPVMIATYRLQLHAGFDLSAATKIVPLLARLGVSHVYTSPMTTARRGSTHGYDVVDPTRLNPELGDDAALRAFVSELHRNGLGLLLDIVPNHMGTGDQNRFWDDVLAHGQGSPYAEWFDIDWNPARRSLRGKVLLPVLGASLDEVIAKRELRLIRRGDEVRLQYFEQTFPLDPATLPDDIASVEGPRLRALHDAQHYQLVYWKRAANEINYRRFFEINELAALNADRDSVFAATHELALRWLADGSVNALRVDHVDGLLEPRAYLERLRAAAGPDVPILVEKILMGDERLREDWPVQGTTGYEFMNQLESLFVDPAGIRAIDERYREMLHITNPAVGYRDAAVRGKQLILRNALDADVRRLTRLLAPLVRGVPRDDVREAIIQLIAGFDVYRAYVDRNAPPLSDADRAVIERAVANATRRGTPPRAALEQIVGVLLLRDASRSAQSVAWSERLQQVTGPASAKGIEDTALYRYIPLASLNEVGGEPDRPLADAAGALHAANAHRAQCWPGNLLATATHDTKRSGDVRSRLDVLSEMPDAWWTAITRWRVMNRSHRTKLQGRLQPDAHAEYLFYQSLVALWPATALPDEPELAELRRRLTEYMRKAAREAKAQTEWLAPDAEYERALSAFIDRTLRAGDDNPFLRDLARLVERIAAPGWLNALARIAVHLTAPGTPDIYQGDELWNHALVDPDNRAPVDFAARAAVLAQLDARWDAGDARERQTMAAELVASPADGRIKLHVTHRALLTRRASAELFARGSYVPITATGDGAGHLFAFARVFRDRAAITVVPRLTLKLGAEPWGDTELELPPELASIKSWRHAFTDAIVSGPLRAPALLRSIPVALITGQRSDLSGQTPAPALRNGASTDI